MVNLMKAMERCNAEQHAHGQRRKTCSWSTDDKLRTRFKDLAQKFVEATGPSQMTSDLNKVFDGNVKAARCRWVMMGW